jgi:hypothetical protein
VAPPRRGRAARLAAAVGAVALAAFAVAAPAREAPGAAAQTNLIAYRMVDQWPQRDQAAQGLFQSPSDLDVSLDGRVYIADPGIGGIHTLLPTGSFTTPFGVTGGFPAQLGQVGPIAIGPGPLPGGGPIGPFGPERIYVLDTAVERVVMYSLDGQYTGQWEKINGQSIAASIDARVYVLDRDSSQVRALDALTGQEKFAFGVRGTDDGQFANFTDVDVSPDGRVLAVGDKRGMRVQLFDLPTDEQLAASDPPPAPATLRTVYDLREAKYTQQDNTCDGSRINALGGDKVFIGQGLGACLVDKRTVAFAIAASANRGAICRDTVTLPRLRAMTQQYYALAVNDPNAGRCGAKRTDLDTSPIVVKYDDEALKGVNTVWEAASNEDSENPILFAPEAISMPAPDVVFVADASSQLRFFSRDGQQVATSERFSQAGNFNTDFEFFYLVRGDGADVLGEVFGYYVKGQRRGTDFTLEGGIGRFKTVEKRTQTGIEKVIEPVWIEPLVSTFEQIEVPALVYNRVTNELLVVRNETIAQQRTQDVKIVRYAPGGRKLKPDFDLPDDGKTNPYVDLTIGPDGRIFALDDLQDQVRIYQPDGTHVIDVPVAFDARNVAGGPPSPDGAVFILREPGSIERYADDGRITARLDGRPLPFSDPTTLADIVVDADGRVYVADGQSSLISVFEATTDQDEIPIPNDAECLFKGKAVANPTQLDLGASTTVTLTLAGRCGINEDPADIVVVTPYFKRLQMGVDPSAAYVTELTQLMSRVNFAKHRAGIVTYWNTTTVELPLTSDRSAYMQKVRDLTRFDPPSPDVKPQLKNALEEAGKLFDDTPGRRKVVILLRAEYCTPENEFYPGQCAGVRPAEDTALALRQAGVTLVVVNSIQAFELASSDEDALFGVEYVHRRMVRYAPPPVLATDLQLTDEIPTGMDVDPAGITGGGTWVAPMIRWTVPSVDFDGLVAAARLVPTQGGTWPTSVETVAEFTDGWGAAQRVVFPIPAVNVIAPTTAPTATAPPPTPTAVPPTPRPEVLRSVFLPIAYVGHCEAKPVPLEVALVVDISGSMFQPTTPGGPSKIQAARELATAFIGALRPTDRVAVVAFDAHARLLVPLAEDHAAARQAIAGLTTGSGSRIDRGLTAATEALAARRAFSSAVLLLLSDGRPSSSLDQVRAAGAAARSAGIAVYGLGLGEDVDPVLLGELAGDPARYLPAPAASDLVEFAGGLTAETRVVCP